MNDRPEGNAETFECKMQQLCPFLIQHFDKLRNSSPDESCQNDASPYTKSSLRDFFTVLALSFHAVFEGLAVGLETESKDVWLLFAGNFIVYHVTKSFHL